MKKQKIIGLCGGSGAGKGEVCRLFDKYGIPSVDTDVVSKIVMQKGHKCYDEVVEAFGNDILDENGEIIRKKLASYIYSDIKKKKMLETITHRHIIDYTLKKFDKLFEEGYEYVMVDAPMLFESGMDKICHKTVAVIADENLRIERIMSRDNITREFALSRIHAQHTSEELKSLCDIIIYNDSDLFQLDLNVRKAINEIKN